MNITALAAELTEAYATRRLIEVPPSARGDAFDISTAYDVEAALVAGRRAAGHRVVGRKVGFANRAMWRKFGLETLVWAPMYDDTVHHAVANQASLPVGALCSAKIEPEIVVKLRAPLDRAGLGPGDALAAIEWYALGFEIINCAYAGWTFTPADFVASFGFHAGLIVGEPRAVTPDAIPSLVEQLAAFTVRLMKDGETVAEGGGRNVLKSPALCLAELAAAVVGRPGAEPLMAGDLISTGTLSDAQFIAPGQTWTAAVDGLDLPALTLRTE